MSDFFSNLAGRLLGVSEVVRPRLPALFETPEREAKLSVEEASRAQALPPRDRDGTHEAASPPPANAPYSKPLDSAPQDKSEKAPARRVPETTASTPPKPSPPADRSPMERAVAREKAKTESVEYREHHDEPAPAKDTTERAAMNAPPTQTAEPVAKRDGQPLPVPQPTPTPRTAARSPFAPPPTPRVAAKRPKAQRRESESTIHVSIGLVEIRATGEKQSPRREKENSPVMSLDDYLRSRAR